LNPNNDSDTVDGEGNDNNIKVKVKVKFNLEQATNALDGGGWSTPRSGRFTPRKDTVAIVQEAGWSPGPFWKDADNLAPTGIRSPNRQGRSELLYRLSYPGPR
jgi:hypothetical protein